MKILISTLLLTIAVFQHFGELNASGNQEARPALNRKRKFHVPVDSPETKGDAHETIPYKDNTPEIKMISLWLDSTRKTVLKADFIDSYVPPSGFFRKNTFFIRLIYVGEWTAVGYFKPNWEIFGVRAPNLSVDLRKTSEPTISRWYIVYWGHRFIVTENPENAHVTAITLFPKNVHETPENRNRFKPEKITLGGVSFIIYIAPDYRILGAELNREIHSIP